MAEIGIVIVTYNSEAHIGACLDSALRSGADVVVVDNGSSDGTAAETVRRGARLVANPANRGFAGAANQGFRVLNCPYVSAAESRRRPAEGLDALREACDLQGAAAAGGRLVDSQGRPQEGFMVRAFPTPAALALEVLVLNRIWPDNPVNRRYRGMGLDYAARIQVDQPAGAFLMVRREVWAELGGFDEGFFPLWFEDVDFCRRAANRGHKFYYVPAAVARHTGGHSISALTVEKRLIYWYGSLLRYSVKHFRPGAFRVVCLAVVMGSLLRSVAESVLHRSVKPLAAYGKVVRHASRCLLSGWGEEAV